MTIGWVLVGDRCGNVGCGPTVSGMSQGHEGIGVQKSSGVRLSEVIAAVSLAADLGMGQPMEHVLRSCMIATRFARPPDGMRPVNLHLRIAGRANARYAVLFRDFLKAHPLTTANYAEAKRRLAALCETTSQYADAKDPICDLIYLPAEEWAESTGWQEPWTADRRGSGQRP